ncbi:COPII-coated vesicle component Sfb3 [Schizosaccharomyces octosporus yFS286]|uniref:COPII-coated vesicle component Sfb3 n=1 Tax=Schizosaccharomyces octosporus (strain yFS286) TaxID=483514 RepID=S9Q3I0_SCHOY|nr:COPII-coated vesicle component Sfb3 [Schizosaccharomyces octosporus yFS286]EPX74228.1 COPII-coated vesicle component Sfb3 [Schizosaccharomyces octosporus yFS286]
MAYSGQYGQYGTAMNPEVNGERHDSLFFNGDTPDAQLASQVNAQMNLGPQIPGYPQERKRTRRHRDAHAYDLSLMEPEANYLPPLTPSTPLAPAAQPLDTSGVSSEAVHEDTNLLDPKTLPSVPDARFQDQSTYKNYIFNSMDKANPPLSTTDFIGYEQNNSSSKFVQMTTYAIPSSNDVLNTSGLPLGMIVQPFAETRPDEAPVPVVDYTTSSPPRCKKCRGYINPFVQFTLSRSGWTCNLCGSENSLSNDVYNPMLFTNQQNGFSSQPELNVGTVDFEVGKDYWAAEESPQPAQYVFVIDVSYEATSKGIPKIAAEAIRDILYGPTPLHPSIRVSIIAFDRNVHFFYLTPNLEQPRMISVADLENPFVPFKNGLSVDPMESRAVIERLLDTLPSIVEDIKVPEPTVGNAMECIKHLLKETGGKSFLFVSALPTMGLGRLRYREDQRLYGNPEEKNLWNTQDKWYSLLADELVTSGISIDIFFTPTAYVDVATVGSVATLTGGQVWYYGNFVPERDGPRLKQDLYRSVTREQGFRVMLKTRCSNGLRVSRYLGNFLQRTPQDIELGGLDADKSIGMLFNLEGKLNNALDAHFQTAILYTTPMGSRRVRVINYCCAVTSRNYDTISLACVEPLVGIFSKIASMNMATESLKAIATKLVEGIVKLLSCYRKVASSRLTPGQLVLPKHLILLPIYMLSVLKSSAFRNGSIHSDVRVSQFRFIRASPLSQLMLNLYPQIYALHSLQPNECIPNADDPGCTPIEYPLCVRASRKFIEDGGAFLIVTGQKVFLWLHQRTSPLLLQDLLGVNQLEQIDSMKACELPEMDNLLSIQVRNLLSALKLQYPHISMQPQIVRQGIDGSEGEVFSTLVEDPSREGVGYVEFLTMIHETLHSQGFK